MSHIVNGESKIEFVCCGIRVTGKVLNGVLRRMSRYAKLAASTEGEQGRNQMAG